MSEKETWFAIEVSRAGEDDWYASTNTTYDSAEWAWREVRKMRKQKHGAWNPQTWEFRVIRKDLTTTVEPEPVKPARRFVGICAVCRQDIGNMRQVVRSKDGALFHGRCWK